MSRTLHTISHYDDDKLRFNDKTGRYELTVEYCKDEFDANFKDDRKLEKRIKLNSQVVYGSGTESDIVINHLRIEFDSFF